MKQNRKIDYIIYKRRENAVFNTKFVDKLISILTDFNMQVTKENKVTQYVKM